MHQYHPIDDTPPDLITEDHNQSLTGMPSLFLRRDSGQAEARTVARRDEPSETTAFACIGTGSSKSNYQFDAICLAG